MRNWTIARITGIPIQINITLVVFLPILAWIISRASSIEANVLLLEQLGPHQYDMGVLLAGTNPWIIGFAAAVGLFVGVTLHELGHAWTARRFHVTITSITLWIFGGMARLEDIPEDWHVEFWIAIAGPITSVGLGVAMWAGYAVLPGGNQLVLFVLGWLAVVNVVLAIFNLLPAFPMDGGRILRAMLARNRPYVDATRTAAAVGKTFAVLMAILGILAFAPLLVLIAMFVYIAATAESRATVLRDLLRGVTVADLMRTTDISLPATTTVQASIDEMMRRRSIGFPIVTADGAYDGIVTLTEVREVAPDRRDSTTIGDISRRELPTVSPTDDVFDVLQTFATNRTDRLAVVSDVQLVGIITHEDIVSAIEVFQGLKLGRPDLLPESGYP